MNLVVILGNLGEKPELKHSKAGKPFCSVSVATSEVFKEEKKTEWHRVVCFGATAENLCKYMAKGKQVTVEGRIATRSYEDKQGQKRYVTEIIANKIHFIGRASDDFKPKEVVPDVEVGSMSQLSLDDIPF